MEVMVQLLQTCFRIFKNSRITVILRVFAGLAIVIIAEQDAKEILEKLKKLINSPVIKAFQIKSGDDIAEARNSAADYVLLDSGKGSGQRFNWELIKSINRPYFLAGGLDTENISIAVKSLRPFAVDVSSGIETDGKKDLDKMTAFVNAVRKEDKNE